MKKHGKVDSNHVEIVETLRKFGCSVQSMAAIGGGCADLLVSRNGNTMVMEVKSKGGKLNPDQVKWRDEWKGLYALVYTPLEALRNAQLYL